MISELPTLNFNGPHCRLLLNWGCAGQTTPVPDHEPANYCVVADGQREEHVADRSVQHVRVQPAVAVQPAGKLGARMCFGSGWAKANIKVTFNKEIRENSID